MKSKHFLIFLLIIALTACAGQTVKETVETTAVEEPAETTVTKEATDQTDEAENQFVFIEGEAITTDSGLQYAIIEAGDGESPQPGNVVQVHYIGRLEGGQEFDNSYERERPIQFGVGTGQVIPGWDEAIRLLKVGDKAKLIIPPELAYGEEGVGDDIPPNSTLYFEMELLDVRPAVYEPPTEVDEADYITTASGLKYYDIKEGDGDSLRAGEMPLVHYTAWLEDGTKIDSSRDRGNPIHFTLGIEQVIPGWDEGVASMKVGGKRQLVIPPELAYGEEGAGNGLIPPNAILIYEVELIAISDYHP